MDQNTKELVIKLIQQLNHVRDLSDLLRNEAWNIQVKIDGYLAGESIDIPDKFAKSGFGFSVHGSKDGCDYSIMIIRSATNLMDASGENEIDGRMGFFNGKFIGQDGKPVDPQPDIMTHVSIPGNSQPYIIDISESTHEAKGAFTTPVFAIWHWISLKWNSLWRKLRGL